MNADAFDALRAARQLAPHDPKLNELRWLTGETLRRLHVRVPSAGLRAVDPDAPFIGGARFRAGLAPAEAAPGASEKWRAAAAAAGPAAWPIVLRIVIEGAHIKECRRMIPELAESWRADCVVADRLRVALDRIAPIVGVTAARRRA